MPQDPMEDVREHEMVPSNSLVIAADGTEHNGHFVTRSYEVSPVVWQPLMRDTSPIIGEFGWSPSAIEQQLQSVDSTATAPSHAAVSPELASGRALVQLEAALAHESMSSVFAQPAIYRQYLREMAQRPDAPAEMAAFAEVRRAITMPTVTSLVTANGERVIDRGVDVEGMFYEVVVPLTEVRGTAAIAISTPLGYRGPTDDVEEMDVESDRAHTE